MTEAAWEDYCHNRKIQNEEKLEELQKLLDNKVWYSMEKDELISHLIKAKELADGIDL